MSQPEIIRLFDEQRRAKARYHEKLKNITLQDIQEIVYMLQELGYTPEPMGRITCWRGKDGGFLFIPSIDDPAKRETIPKDVGDILNSVLIYLDTNDEL